MFYGKKSDVLPFFESIGMPSHPNWNPADFISKTNFEFLNIQYGLSF